MVCWNIKVNKGQHIVLLLTALSAVFYTFFRLQSPKSIEKWNSAYPSGDALSAGSRQWISQDRGTETQDDILPASDDIRTPEIGNWITIDGNNGLKSEIHASGDGHEEEKDATGFGIPNGIERNIQPIPLINKTYLRTFVKDVIGKPKCKTRKSGNIWKSSDENSTCEQDFERLKVAFGVCGPLDVDYLATPPTAVPYDFEVEYLADPPLNDVTTIATASKSSVMSLNKSSNFEVGDTVAFRVDMKDARGKSRVKGGDDVRAWLQDGQFKITAKVIDMRNGSYLVTSSLPWKGHASLQVGLIYSREYLRSLVFLHRILKELFMFLGGYKNEKGCQATPCYHTPLIPGHNRSEVCDLSEVNGSPWFCGRPTRHGLTCKDYRLTRYVNSCPIYLPVTPAERKILDESNKKKGIQLIHHGIKLSVNQGNKTLDSMKELPFCHQMPVRETWRNDVTTGYFQPGGWRSLVCKTGERRNCFQNVTIVFIGDSNGRGNFYPVCHLSRSKQLYEPLTHPWHKPMECVNEGNNFSAVWKPHMLPFWTSSAVFTNISDMCASSKVIDALPSQGRLVVHISLYLHFTSAHFSSLHSYMRAVAAALRRLVNRNKDVRIVLQGPHTLMGGKPIHITLGDFYRIRIEQMHREVFRDLMDHVIYINTADLTIANQNWDIHPPSRKHILNIILSYVCGR